MSNLKTQLEQAAFELFEAKNRLKTAQVKWDQICAQVDSHGQPLLIPLAKTGAESSTSNSNLSSQSEQIMGVLASLEKPEWTYQEISEKLPNIPITSIRVLMYNLRKTNQVEKTQTKKWRLRET